MERRFFPPGTFAPVPGTRDAGAGSRAPSGPLHDPPLAPRDEAVFLLTAAAEIEHALMVQYLYAAYSVRVEGDDLDGLGAVRDTLLQIAREEMGHLATVQNLLHVVGGPLTMHRGNSAEALSIHPFRFRLEPLSRASLARYVVAESPVPPPADLPLLEQIGLEAVAANDGRPLQHVGAIFARLEELFEHGLADDDLRTDTAARHAAHEDWGYEPDQGEGEPLLVDTVGGTDAAVVRAAALEAVRAIGEQGEGYDRSGDDDESHFERFHELYRTVAGLVEAGVPIAWPVATDPNTTQRPDVDPADEASRVVADRTAAGRIDNPTARAWAHLFNLRYRLLLGLFGHFLRGEGPRYVDAGPRSGDRTERGLLLLWSFDEMRHLAKIAAKLVSLPLADPAGPQRAGPPFELPYSLDLPDREPDRWRTHLDVLRATALLDPAELGTDDFLTDLSAADIRTAEVLDSLARGGGIPAGALPSGFAKVVTILEEAVRGFTVGAGHGSFWAGRTRAEFLDPQAVEVPVAHTPDGAIDPDPRHAPLMRMLTSTGLRMPRFRPPVPPARVEHIREWIRAGAPDDEPAGQVGVVHERDPD